jgi:hypothetical protein
LGEDGASLGLRLRSAIFPFAQPHPGHLPLVNSMPSISYGTSPGTPAYTDCMLLKAIAAFAITAAFGSASFAGDFTARKAIPGNARP